MKVLINKISNKDISKKDQLRKISSINNLSRPEGISILDANNLIVAANAGNASIPIYQTIAYNNFKLKQLITGEDLEYVHDVQCTDRFILAVGRGKNCAIIFIKENDKYTKYIEIKGEKTLLNRPTGVSISPDERYVTVANRCAGITVYKLDLNQPGIYSGEPFLFIPLSFFYKFGLSAPKDVVNLSNNKIAILHKRIPLHMQKSSNSHNHNYPIGISTFNILAILKKKWMPHTDLSYLKKFLIKDNILPNHNYPNGISIFNIPESEVKMGTNIDDLFSHIYYFDKSVSTHCHSIAYNSITRSIYFTEERNGIFIMEETDNGTYKFSNIKLDEKKNLKGIAVSKDGNKILVCGEFDRIDILDNSDKNIAKL